MNWIDDDLEERNRLGQIEAAKKEHERLISQSSGQLYEELWKEITDRIEQARDKNIAHFITNGSSFQRKIIVPVKQKSAQVTSKPTEVVIQLAADGQSIVVTGASQPPHFPLERFEDGVVRIMYDGKQQSVEDAARLILRPLMFPEFLGR